MRLQKLMSYFSRKKYLPVILNYNNTESRVYQRFLASVLLYIILDMAKKTKNKQTITHDTAIY